MAESVNHLLSAVTEGHLSNSTASQSTQTIEQTTSKTAGGDNRGKKSTRSTAATIESASRGTYRVEPHNSIQYNQLN